MVTRVSKDKIISAFKGLVNTFKLLPINEVILDTKKAEYRHTLNFFESEDKSFELFYREFSYVNLINLISRYYHDQIDSRYISDCLSIIVAKLIESESDYKNQKFLELAAMELIEQIEQNIHSYIVLIPVDGLVYSGDAEIQLARCLLCNNHPNSDYRKAIINGKDKYFEGNSATLSLLEQTPSFFKVRLEGHSRRVIQKGDEEAELALNVLRLFIGSNYFDLYKNHTTPRLMEIMGSLPSIRFDSSSFYLRSDKPVEEQEPGYLERYKYRKPFELSQEGWIALEESSLLKRINYILGSPEENGQGLFGRIYRTINWFGKASKTRNIAESYLMYAISIESLLSEGNTSKEVYAEQISSLITRDNYKGIYPQGGYVSKEFYKKLSKYSVTAWKSIIYDRVRELFVYRNDIAHGRVLETDIEVSHLLDLETIARNTILAFVDGGWNSTIQFREWKAQKQKENR